MSTEEAIVLSSGRSKLIEPCIECPICVYWTTNQSDFIAPSEHKVCKKCITSLIDKSTACCAIESLHSPIDDIYNIDDNCSRRGSCDITKNCCNNGPSSDYVNGFDSSYVKQCTLRDVSTSPTNDPIKCSFAKCGCKYQASDSMQLIAHNQESIDEHMSMLLKLLTEQKQVAVPDIKEIETSRDHHSGEVTTRDHQSNEELVHSLFDRITLLEKLNREQELKIERLTNQMNKLSLPLGVHDAVPTAALNPQNSCGILIWKIADFDKRVEAMRSNPNNMFYSTDFYTAPFGYRFCARISISPKIKSKDTISLYVHMMQSDNDYHLDWPFRGCIKISMVHKNGKYSFHDKIMTNEKISAFQRPTSEISSHSFGFTEYANINDIISGGFISDDVLTIKLQISIV